MSGAISQAGAAHAAAHHEAGFIRHYVFSTDHKMIAKQFLSFGLAMLVLGGLLAIMVRWELAWPANGPAGISVTLS